MPGIPQESNAVFYHPLDDLTEALQTQPWVGRASPRQGVVPPAQGPARASLSFGSLAPFGLLSLSYPAFVSSAALSASKIVSVCSGSPPGVLDIRAASVSGAVVSYGPAASVNTGGSESSWPAVAAVSGTKFVVAFGAKTYIGTVTGLDITMGPAATIAEAYNPGNEVNCVRLAALSPTLVAAVYKSSATVVKAALGSVSAATVTWSAGNPVATVAGDTAMEIAALDAAHVLVAYFDITPGTIGLRAGAVSGPALLFGGLAASTGCFGTSLRDMALARVSASTAAIVYRDGPVCARVATVSGVDSDVTLGLANAMSDPIAADCISRNIAHRKWLSAAHDGSELAIFCHVTYGAGAVSGSCSNPYEEAVAYLAEIRDGLVAERGASGFANFAGGEAYSSSVVALSDGAMAWTGLTGTSTPKSLAVSTADHAGLALTATSPGAYQTAAGAGKLAFAMWTKPGKELLLQDEVVVEPSLDPIATKLYISPIDSERAVVAYRNGITDSRARVLVLSGGGVTVGPASVINAGNTQGAGFAIAALGNTLVATYIDTSNDTKCKVGSVAGTDITWGAAAPFEAYSSGYTEDVRLHVTGPSTLVAAYLYGGASARPSARVGTLAGLNLTWGARQETPAPVSSPGGMDSSLMGASGLVMSWRENTVVPSPPVRVQTATISGDIVSFGTATTAGSGPLSGMIGALVSGIDSDRFLIVFRDNQASAYPSFPEPDLFQTHAMVGTVSGGVITLGAKALAAATDSSPTALAGLTPSRHALLHVWRPEGGFGGRPVSLLATVGRVPPGGEPVFAGEIYALAAVQWAGGGRAHEAAVVGSSLVAVYISPDQTKVLARAVGVPALVAPPVTTTTTAPPATTTTAAPPPFWGAEQSSLSDHDATSYTSIAPLSATVFVACYRGTFGWGYSRVCTVSGASVTFGPEVTFRPSSNCQYIAAVALTSSKFVVFYEGDTAAVGQVAGTAITYGTPQNFTSGSYGGGVDQTPAACRLASDRFFLCWYHNQDGSQQTGGRLVAVSGTVLTFGAYAVSPDVVGLSMSCAALTDEAVVACFHGNGGQHDARAYVVGISFMTVSWGAAQRFTALYPTDPAGRIKVAALTSDRFVVAYEEGSDTKARIGVVSLSTITWGAAASAAFSSTQTHGVCLISPTEFVHLYRSSDARVRSKVGAVSGGVSILFGAEDELLPVAQVSGNEPNALVRLGLLGPGGGAAPGDRCVAAYNSGGAGHGRVRVGNV